VPIQTEVDVWNWFVFLTSMEWEKHRRFCSGVTTSWTEDEPTKPTITPSYLPSTTLIECSIIAQESHHSVNGDLQEQISSRSYMSYNNMRNIVTSRRLYDNTEYEHTLQWHMYLLDIIECNIWMWSIIAHILIMRISLLANGITATSQLYQSNIYYSIILISVRSNAAIDNHLPIAYKDRRWDYI
jgi:hypothetical protein